MESNSFCKPKFITYFARQWAPIAPLWTGTLLTFLGEKDLLQTNQVAEALFSNLKNFQLAYPEREEAALKDFTKRSGVWEIGSFLIAARERLRYYCF